MSNGKDTKKMNDRCYNFFVMTYLKPEDFLPTLKRDCVKHYAYIHHDKEDCEPHFHIILLLNNAKTKSAVQRMFPTHQNTFAEVLLDKGFAFDYLTHENEPEEVPRYDKKDIVTDNFNYFYDICTGNEKEDKDEKTIAIIDDILAKMPARELLYKWGRDVVINFDKYLKFADRITSELCVTPAKMPASLIDEESGEVVYGKLKR